jgi:hypothetical protein
MFEIIKNNLIYKILENSLPKLFIKYEQPLGRWNRKNCNNLMSFYANTDHCGDKICGDVKVLKKTYPKNNNI